MFGNYTISSHCSTHDHVCEVDYSLEPSDNFQNDPWDHFRLAIYCDLIICFTGIFSRVSNLFTEEEVSFYKRISILSTLIITLIAIIDFYRIKTCLFPRWCHEGIDDTIIPTYYFYQMNECPTYSSWLTYDYSDSDINHNDLCESTEYGCCEVVNIDCDAAYRDGDTYSLYQMIVNDYRGHWQMDINKIDEEGSNCPTIEEIIYRSSENDKNPHLIIYLSFTITIMIIMCLGIIYRICIRKESYKKTESDDVEKSTLWEESSEDDDEDDDDDDDDNDDDNDVTEKSWSLQASV